jgi:hypothetical protein
MSPITATAIPEGKARGAGLRATMASTTATDWNIAPALDASKEFIRLLAKFATMASSPHHRPSAPDARGSRSPQAAGVPMQTGSAPGAHCTPSRVRRRAASQVEFEPAVFARIAWCPDIVRGCRVCGLPWRMPYAPPMDLECRGRAEPLQLRFPDWTAPASRYTSLCRPAFEHGRRLRRAGLCRSEQQTALGASRCSLGNSGESANSVQLQSALSASR